MPHCLLYRSFKDEMQLRRRAGIDPVSPHVKLPRRRGIQTRLSKREFIV